jgi:hypothetical protein
MLRFLNFFDHIEARHPWHGEIKEGNVGTVNFDTSYGFEAIPRFIDDFQIRLRREKGVQSFPEDRRSFAITILNSFFISGLLLIYPYQPLQQNTY